MIRSIAVKPAKITGTEDALILPLFKGEKKLAGAALQLNRTCRSIVTDYLKNGSFTGDLREVFMIRLSQAKTPKNLLLLGLGKQDELNAEEAADCGGEASKAAAKGRLKSASVLCDGFTADGQDPGLIASFIKGFMLAQYRYSLAAKPPPPSPLQKLYLLCDGDRRNLKTVAKTAMIVTEYTAKVRDLVNAPSNELTPAALAREALATSKSLGIHCRVLGLKEIKSKQMGAILDVARGSHKEPKLIVMHLNKTRKSLPTVCLVGKGVTFDSGGISLKPWDRMNEMKGDMAGAALVIGVIAAAARLKVPLQLVGVIPAVENMPDGDSFKPGDVVKTYSGKTVEVMSTDAEGRLILSDAITFVRKHYDPIVTVDFATLTGAVLIALGTRIAGVMGNSQRHIDMLVAAGNTVGEPVWQLPLDRRFYKSVEGDITDYKNFSGRNGSTITAAALLGKFAGDAPWMHVDIAGTFWNDGNASYHSKGATGFGVDLTLKWLERIAQDN